MNIQPTVAALSPQSTQSNRVVGAAAGALKPARGSTGPVIAAAQLSLPAAVPVPQPDRAALEAATQSVRDFVKPVNNSLDFSIDEDSGQVVVKIIDTATKEVIRQMPSAEMLAIARTLDSIKGLFVKQTA